MDSGLAPPSRRPSSRMSRPRPKLSRRSRRCCGGSSRTSRSRSRRAPCCSSPLGAAPASQSSCSRSPPHCLARELTPHVPAAEVTHGADQPEGGLPDMLPPGDQGQHRVLHQVLAVRRRDAICLERFSELRPHALEDRRDVGRPFRMIPIDHRARSRHRRRLAYAAGGSSRPRAVNSIRTRRSTS